MLLKHKGERRQEVVRSPLRTCFWLWAAEGFTKGQRSEIEFIVCFGGSPADKLDIIKLIGLLLTGLETLR